MISHRGMQGVDSGIYPPTLYGNLQVSVGGDQTTTFQRRQYLGEESLLSLQVLVLAQRR
jgi:hypothetical protein